MGNLITSDKITESECFSEALHDEETEKCILPRKHFAILHSCQILPLRPGTKGALDVSRKEDFQIRGKGNLRCNFLFWYRALLCSDIIPTLEFPLERSHELRGALLYKMGYQTL